VKPAPENVLVKLVFEQPPFELRQSVKAK